MIEIKCRVSEDLLTRAVQKALAGGGYSDPLGDVTRKLVDDVLAGLAGDIRAEALAQCRANMATVVQDVTRRALEKMTAKEIKRLADGLPRA